MESKDVKVTIALVGDFAVGKSAFTERHTSGDFNKEHNTNGNGVGEKSMTCKISKILRVTNKGLITFNVIESNVPDVQGADAYILMFDVTRPETYVSVPDLYSKFTNKNAPIILCGNKVDCRDRKVRCKSITFHREVKGVNYVDLSNKSLYNIDLPLTLLLRHFMGEDAFFMPIVNM